MNVRIRYNPKFRGSAEVAGFWPFRRIVTGPRFEAMPGPIQRAVISHELGHCRGFHSELRLLLCIALPVPLLIVLSWQTIVALILTLAMIVGAQYLAHAQEYAADRYAIKRGDGMALLRLLQQAPAKPWWDFFHPEHTERSERIMRLLKEKANEVAA